MTIEQSPTETPRQAPILLLGISLILLILGVLPSGLYGPFPASWKLAATRPFSYAAYAVRDVKNGDLYVMDATQKRLTRINADGVFLGELDGGSRDVAGFFHAVDVAPDADRGFFLLSSEPDDIGTFHVKEKIQYFDRRGRYRETLFALDNTGRERTTLMHHGSIRRLNFDGKKRVLSWIQCVPEGIRGYAITVGDHSNEKTTFEETARKQVEPIWEIPYDQADRDIADAAFYDESSIVATHKNGRIYKFPHRDGAAQTILFDSDKEPLRPGFSVPAVPWGIGTDAVGNIYFVDMTHREVRRIPPAGEIATVFSAKNEPPHKQISAIPLSGYDYYRLQAAPDGTVTLTNDVSVLVIDGHRGEIRSILQEMSIPNSVRAGTLLSRIGIILIGVGVLLLGFFLYWSIIGLRVPLVLFLTLALVLAMAITAYISLSVILTDSKNRNTEQFLTQLKLLARKEAETIDSQAFLRIRKPGDYMDADYLAVRRKLEKDFDQSIPEMKGFVFTLYRVFDGRLYGLMYNNTIIGPYYPFTWLDDPDQQCYRDALDGKVSATYDESIAGDWYYGLAPVRDDKGAIIGILEVATESYTFKQKNGILISTIVMDTAVLLVVFILIMIELIFLANALWLGRLQTTFSKFLPKGDDQSQREKYQEIMGTFSPCFLSRPLAFLYFVAASVSLPFMPLMMQSFYEPVPGFSKNMILAIPTSAYMFCFGVSNLVAGYGAKPKNFRRILYVGLFFSAAGFLAAALSYDMLSFAFSQGLIGIGGGFTFIGIRSIVLIERRKTENEAGYAHFYAGGIAGGNVGIVLGATLADNFGYAAPFYFALVVLALAAMLECACLKDYFHEGRLRASQKNSPKADSALSRWNQGWREFRLFLSDPRVSAFLLLNTIPTFTVVAFSIYYFPLFAEENGLSTTAIGRYLLLAGMLTVFLGPPLTTALTRIFGVNRAFYVCALTWSAAMFVYVFTGTLGGVIATVLILHVIDGAAGPCSNYYFLGLRGAKAVGEERAVAFIELGGKIGETLGPIIFACLLAFGGRRGTATICVLCLVCTGLLILINRLTNTTKND